MNQTAILQAPCEIKSPLSPFQRLSNKYSLERSIRALQRDIKYLKYTETITLSASLRFREVRRLEAEASLKELELVK
jgi:hypothetical protein